MGGGNLRGPVGIVRQRRTIRFVQICLVLIAALLMLAGYSMGRVKGFEQGRRGTVGAPAAPSSAKTVVIAILGLGALGAAVLLQGQGGVRLPSPPASKS